MCRNRGVRGSSEAGRAITFCVVVARERSSHEAVRAACGHGLCSSPGRGKREGETRKEGAR